MDLSGMIFVALAIGWAVYLLPKALRHHDEEDRRRSVEEFSDKVRVVGRGRTPVVEVVETVAARAQTQPPVVEPVETPAARAQTQPPVVEPVETPAAGAPTRTITREAARSAARRRRRVLALLLSTLAVVSVTSYLAYTPWLVTALPIVLIVAFLVTARLTVRAQQTVRRSAPAPPPKEQTSAAPVNSQAAVAAEVDLEGEDTQGLSRAELDEVLAEPVLDEGGLWDPLPMTLPTYVNKARARRTVRTIELTAASTGITSSGHDPADSALAREAATSEVEAEADVVETPKAAGA